jgi:hypothetical protein
VLGSQIVMAYSTMIVAEESQRKSKSMPGKKNLAKEVALLDLGRQTI